MVNKELRLLVATQAENFCRGKITYSHFVASIPPEALQDNLIEELLDLIEHEPKKGGLFGVSKKDYSQYRDQISLLIQKLKEQPGLRW